MSVLIATLGGSEDVVKLMIDTYGPSCIVGDMDNCVSEVLTVPFDTWYKQYNKVTKDPENSIADIFSARLPTITECGQIIDRLVKEQRENPSDERRIKIHLIKRLFNCLVE